MENLGLMSDLLDVLYRDEHLIAIHKPAGLLVHRPLPPNPPRLDARDPTNPTRCRIGWLAPYG